MCSWTPNHRHLHQLILSISEDSIKCYESHLYFDSKSVFTILCWIYKHCKLRVWFLGILRQPTPESDDRQSRTSKRHVAHSLLTHFIGLFRNRLYVDWNNSVQLKHFRVKFIPLDTKDLRRIHEVRYANLGSRVISKELTY